jgi:hypothetical protein
MSSMSSANCVSDRKASSSDALARLKWTARLVPKSLGSRRIWYAVLYAVGRAGGAGRLS